MNRIINDNNIFKIIQKSYISNEDYHVLFMLYQPLVGIEAVNLYLTLLQEKKLTTRINLDFNHGRLKILLKLSTTQLIMALQQLETANLINTYYYELKSTYIYELLPPLTAADFFANDFLNAELSKQVGNLNYERQKFYFLTNDVTITENYVNISKMKNTIPHALQVKTALNKIYAVREETNINQLYPFHSEKLEQVKVNLATSPQKLVSKNNNDIIINNTLKLMQNKSPIEYLSTLIKQIPTVKLTQTLTTLINDYQLNNATINCLLEYVWFKNNKRLEPNYILKIAQTFKENNITTIDEALQHLKLAYAHSKKHSFQTFEQESLWSLSTTLSNSKKKINQTINYQTTNNETSNIMTQEEINNILKQFDDH